MHTAAPCVHPCLPRMGRPGTAYSLLTREEVPYLLDLHLFLGRQIQPAPLVPDPAAEPAVGNEGPSL
jgi:ATP-dependent RNA helicase DDX54/DBP10